MSIFLYIDECQSKDVLCDDDYSDEYIYYEIYGGGTGEWLILKKE